MGAEREASRGVPRTLHPLHALSIARNFPPRRPSGGRLEVLSRPLVEVALRSWALLDSVDYYPLRLRVPGSRHEQEQARSPARRHARPPRAGRRKEKLVKLVQLVDLAEREMPRTLR